MGERYELKINLVIPRYQIRGITLEGLQPGESLEGEVILTPREEINCRGVWLEIGWFDRGKGTSHENRLMEAMFFQGKLKAGETLAHRITFAIPKEAPVSYAGQLVTVEWYVRVRIDIPFWFDIREERYFRVIPHLVRERDEADFSMAEKFDQARTMGHHFSSFLEHYLG